MMACRELVIHVGQHKTATTSIQAFAMTHRAELELEGICYPLAGTFPHYPAHHNLAWQARGDTRFDPAAGTLEQALEELLATRAPRGLLSSEDFAWLMARPASLLAFDRKVREAGFEIRYVAFYRNREAAAQSLYGELLKHGVSCSREVFEELVARDGHFLTHGDWLFEFDEIRLRRRWLAATGAELELYDFDGAAAGRGVLPEFWRAVGASPAIQRKSADAPRFNVTGQPFNFGPGEFAAGWPIPATDSPSRFEDRDTAA